jgi:hypothetical protein
LICWYPFDVFIGSSVGLGDVIYDNYKKTQTNDKKYELDKTKVIFIPAIYSFMKNYWKKSMNL